MERDRKDDGGVSVEREDEGRRGGGEGWGGEAGDEMRQRLRAGFKPTMSRVNGMYSSLGKMHF